MCSGGIAVRKLFLGIQFSLVGSMFALSSCDGQIACREFPPVGLTYLGR